MLYTHYVLNDPFNVASSTIPPLSGTAQLREDDVRTDPRKGQQRMLSANNVANPTHYSLYEVVDIILEYP